MHEVIVVGAGPAGSAAATVLARAGRDVLLLDRVSFPRDKPCGDGITLAAIMEMQRIGNWYGVQNAGFKAIHGVHYVAPSGRVLEFSFSSDQPARTLIAPRRHFDNLLKDCAVSSGARFRILSVIAPLLS